MSSFAGFSAPLALAAALAFGLSWLIPVRPQRPHLFRTSLVVAVPWLAGHLAANGLNFFFPPAAGVDWLIFLCPLWTAVAGLAALHSPSVNWRRREAALLAGTLALGAAAFYLAQSKLAWLFQAEESANTRRLLAVAVAVGGYLFAGGWVLLARLLPAWAFWLSAAVLAAALSASISAYLGPLWIAAVQALPAAVAAGAGVGTFRQPGHQRVSGPVAAWMAVLTGLPLVWATISRSPAGPWQVPVLLMLLPVVVFIVLKPLAARLHPVGLGLISAGLLLLGGTALLHFSSQLPEFPPENQVGDDAGAYD